MRLEPARITEKELWTSTVKALSWKPPYGEMMLHGKQETRTWDTPYRGIVLICLSKAAYNLETITEMSGQVLTDQILAKTIDQENFSGHAIALGRLQDTRHMTEADEADTYVKYKGVWIEKRKSKKTGIIKEVSVRQWVHIYTNVTPIIPFAWEGSQGWKTLTDTEKLLITPL